MQKYNLLADRNCELCCTLHIDCKRKTLISKLKIHLAIIENIYLYKTYIYRRPLGSKYNSSVTKYRFTINVLFYVHSIHRAPVAMAT